MASELSFLVTPAALADKLSMPRQRVYRMIRRGRIKAHRVEGGRLVVDVRELPKKL